MPSPVGAGAQPPPALVRSAEPVVDEGYPVDLARLRAGSSPATSTGPTTPRRTVRTCSAAARPAAAAWKVLQGKVLSGTATDVEIGAWFDHRRQVSADAIAVARTNARRSRLRAARAGPRAAGHRGGHAPHAARGVAARRGRGPRPQGQPGASPRRVAGSVPALSAPGQRADRVLHRLRRAWRRATERLRKRERQPPGPQVQHQRRGHGESERGQPVGERRCRRGRAPRPEARSSGIAAARPGLAARESSRSRTLQVSGTTSAVRPIQSVSGRRSPAVPKVGLPPEVVERGAVGPVLGGELQHRGEEVDDRDLDADRAAMRSARRSTRPSRRAMFPASASGGRRSAPQGGAAGSGWPRPGRRRR